MNASSIEQNETFELAYRFITETSENIFLTGKAGTGKTTFLKYLKDHCSKNIIVAAPTGVAAINAGGVTLHSLFQLPFHPFLPTNNNRQELLSKLKFNKQRQQLLRKMELLVIDEISMVRCDVIDAIDCILRSVRRSYDLAFGGVQLLCIGDLYQLPPVAQHHEWSILKEYYASPFFFDSNVIKEQMPLLIELKKIYRQKDDAFVNLLNKVRNNEMDTAGFHALHTRHNAGFKPLPEEKYITLNSHNNQADYINNRELQNLHALAYKYEAVVEGDFFESNYPAEASLVLKEGAQVMFLKNDSVLKRYFNGKIGVIASLKNEEIVVDCDAISINVSKEVWQNSRYTLNHTDGKLIQETTGTFTQFPLRLAWAITIHKSQGLTFEKVVIDAAAAFASGQVYVALSRCTSLEGIVLLSKIPAQAIQSNAAVVKGQQALQHKGSLAERFKGARQIFTQNLLEDIFSFNEIMTAADLLQFKIHEQKDKLNPDAYSWIESLYRSFAEQKDIGLRFIKRIADLMKEEPVIENNLLLQKRITDAAEHFKPKISSYQQSLFDHPLITEHREVATAIDELLNQLAISMYASLYFLQHCRQPFSIASFLLHKLQYVQPRYYITCYASKKNQSVTDVPNAALYNNLKQWRDAICNKTNTPIYMVASKAALLEVVTFLPLNKTELIQLSGFGEAKADKYGEDILLLVNEYCVKNNIATNMAAKLIRPKAERKQKSNEVKINSSETSYNLFKEGKSIEEIAKERNFAVSTVEGHLAWFVASGNIDINALVLPEKQNLIKKAIEQYGHEAYKTLKENLPPDVTYGDLRFVVASEKKLKNNF